MTEHPVDPRDYLLGTGDEELDRLGYQARIWRDSALRALDRAGVKEGSRVLDLGSGPGFVTEEIRAHVGETGSVVALDPSPRWHKVLRQRFEGAPNVTLVESSVEDADLAEGTFDAVFSRWVFSFLPDLDGVATKVLRALRPGGALVVQDYNHDGIGVFPPSPGFEAVVRATRDYYARGGGDAWVVGSLPAILSRAGFEGVECLPEVRCGGPDSDVFGWADAFFPRFSSTYVDEGLMTAEERDRFLEEWSARRAEPGTLFFSPIVADVVGRRPTH
ncbi:MAG: methyltransferase domain-containing protein [Planctomycetota bacterium]